MNQIHDSDPLLYGKISNFSWTKYFLLNQLGGNTPLVNEDAWNILTTGQETAHFQNPTIEQMLTQTN